MCYLIATHAHSIHTLCGYLLHFLLCLCISSSSHLIPVYFISSFVIVHMYVHMFLFSISQLFPPWLICITSPPVSLLQSSPLPLFSERVSKEKTAVEERLKVAHNTAQRARERAVDAEVHVTYMCYAAMKCSWCKYQRV